MIEPVKTIPYDVNQYRAELCRKEFFYFVQTFWEVIIPGNPNMELAHPLPVQ